MADLISKHQRPISAALAAAALAAMAALPAGAIAASARGNEGSGVASAPSNLEPLTANQSTGILGKKIVDPSGKDLGMVVDVVVDHGGRPLAVVIDFGGFLGVGSRKIAVDWNLLRFEPSEHGRRIVLNIGRRELQGAPEYKANAGTTEMVGPPLVGPSFFPGEP